MKTIYIKALYIFMALCISTLYIGCSDDDEGPNGGQPRIRYVRMTDPASSDSLLVASYQSNMVAIMGENLGATVEVWFNDKKAGLLPTLVTNTSILTTIPSELPEVINDQLKLVFDNGDSLMYDFTVEISEPFLRNMMSEYVSAGDTARIRGQYFYGPLEVTFSGGVTAEVININEENTIIDVIVPEGAEKGPVTIESNFGVGESGFWFRDDRNIIMGSEETDFSGWWGTQGWIAEQDTVIENINGNFVRLDESIGAWGWIELYTGDGGTIKEATSNIPRDAFNSPDSYSVKFEVYPVSDMAGAQLRMFLGNADDFNTARQNNFYTWAPNFNVTGKWQTISIPFNEFLANNSFLTYNEAGYQAAFYFTGPVPSYLNFALDNVRVVPNEE
ncbi:glycan-binding surface protein [Fulvivirga maritima]|uniref:glycan-binding surface protein n=1 Tax=Fulvivirga maritima TaxID=2904247 RepID=UPI001F291200|nr:glycan-binding surface protein [Fulvivirga maritima]UII24597.1 glycan-binding surface protein [Fulvivirga maritima]